MDKAVIPTDLVIFSGAYIGDEMAAEFGLIPPSFLPLGGKRLFEHQVQLSSGKTYLSLPEDFEIPKVDKMRLAALDVEIARVAKGLSLRASALAVLSELDLPMGAEVIFGDTLVNGPCPESPDLVSFQNDPAHHFWSYYSGENPDAPFVAGFGDGITDRRILCGHFRFSDVDLLKQSLGDAKDFVQALNLYEQQKPFKKCMVETWFDFGHLSLYHQSKRNFAVARSFNSIESDGKSVRKSSAQTNKIRAEAYWYENLPAELKLHAPQYLGRDDQDFLSGYRMEYVYLPLLSDLFVFGNLPGHVWFQILGRCFEFLEIANGEKPAKGTPESAPEFASEFFDFMFVSKTRNRLDEFTATRKIAPDTVFTLNSVTLPPLSNLVEALFQNIRPSEPRDISFLHGDFFFGNAFFDFRSTRVTVIDPRAMLGDGAPVVFGDIRYDVAKLSHSVLGAYDHIINGRSQLEKHSEFDWGFIATDIDMPAGMAEMVLNTAQKSFGIDRAELLSMTALLFFSMLPLHSDSPQRQDHLFANGLRLAADALGLS
ncbi:MAG: hypothetical protein L3J33_08160 [Rhodobacteraceae bacterium]|nr:hypothetical protein [Paracoccaceae bacterium]